MENHEIGNNELMEGEEDLDQINEFSNSPLHHINKVIQNEYVVNKPSGDLIIQNKNNNNLNSNTKIEDWSNLCKVIKNVNIKRASITSEEDLIIYSCTFNMKGKKPKKEHMKLLLPKETNNGVKYNLYVIGSQECMRTIFMSFFNNEMSEWIELIR